MSVKLNKHQPDVASLTPKSSMLLGKIKEIEPEWDDWYHYNQIHTKAKNLGLFCDITLDDYITSSGEFPKRRGSPEFNFVAKRNAEALLLRVNDILKALGKTHASVNSGFRTQFANSVAKGSKNSGHLTGVAIDIADPGNEIDEAIINNPEILEDFDLYMEHPSYTPGWCHLDTKRRLNRIFHP